MSSQQQASTSKQPMHRLPVTAATLSEDGRSLFTAGKDGSILRWRIQYSPSSKLTLAPCGGITKTITPKAPSNSKGKGKGPQIEGHTDEIWALAVSGDGKYLVSGGKDRKVCVWDIASVDHGVKFLKSFERHRDSISAMTFRKRTNQLLTASFDRTVNVYDLSPNTMGYVETLFGHQDKISSIDSLRADCAVSSGGRDKTARWWKIGEETQLVFRGGGRTKGLDALDDMMDEEDLQEERRRALNKEKEKTRFAEGSLECVVMVDDNTFLSGGDSGSICLWSTGKKKPVFTFPLAHGLQVLESSTEGEVKTPRWITSLASLRYSDLFASGSWDGQIRLWKINQTLKSFEPLPQFSIPAKGVINSLQIMGLADAHPFAAPTTTTTLNAEQVKTRLGAILVAGVGLETRMGRWITVKESGVKNCGIVVGLEMRV